MAYQIAAIRMTLSDLQGHSPTARLSKRDFSRAAVEQLTRFQLT